jgi:hypothetical protein
LAVRLLSAGFADFADFAARPTAWTRCESPAVASSPDPRPKIDPSLPASPCLSLLGASGSVFAAGAARAAIPWYQRIMPIKSTPADVNSISGNRSISG